MAKHTVLFHGRHLLYTAFQEQYLRALVEELSKNTKAEQLVEVVFAVTSANHANSRYNPVPFHYRAIGIDVFARKVLESLKATWSIVPIPHMPPTEKFIERVISYAHATREGRPISPEVTVVICSTPALIEQFDKAGYEVRTSEYDAGTKSFIAETPQTLLARYAAHISDWHNNEQLKNLLSSGTLDLWRTYPEIPREIERLWKESLLTEQGDITETRDYSTYSFSMSRGDVIELKYKDIEKGIIPGVIVDEGCADGALLARIAKDFPDSDLIGIEITREFLAEAQERQRRGGFGNSFVFFYQRNLSEKIFADDSIDTTLCNSTTHEIWSYGGGDKTLSAYLAHKYAQLKPGGALLIRDVVGPEGGEEELYAWFADSDGATPTVEEALKTPVAELSTRGRFYRFAKEYLNGRGVVYTEEDIDGKKYIIAKRKDIADFMSKKDYTDNWESELHESFTHWSFSRWRQELEKVGFTFDEGLSRAYTNPWIVENRWQGTVELFTKKDAGLSNGLAEEPLPPTNLVIVAHK